MMKRKKGLSILLAVSLLLGSIGIPSYAAGLDERTIQLGTEGLDSVVEEVVMLPDKHYNPQDYLYLGKAGEQPIKWRVLDAEKNNAGENTGIFLLSETVVDILQFDTDETANEGQTNPNEWQNSDIVAWFKNTLTGTTYFTQSELDSLQAVTKTEPAQEAGPEAKFGYPMEENTLVNEKLFAPSIPEIWEYVSTYRGVPGLKVLGVDGAAKGWWTRTALGNNPLHVMMFDYSGWHFYVKVSGVWGARPATNIAKNAVLFTSQAEGGKSLGNSLGLEAVEYGSVKEWKLTLLDSSRQFALQERTKQAAAGESITLTYSGAKTGDKEYISALLVKAGEVLSYGRILKPTQASGNVTIDLPDTLSDGVYSLHVFNEEYNGGEEDNTK
ncbi:MAG: hypothetical protein IKW28_02880, partial [Lachnospiraceae bacterium]|nr:hypothetical protein [Lachnospiraceae bacterium]